MQKASFKIEGGFEDSCCCQLSCSTWIYAASLSRKAVWMLGAQSPLQLLDIDLAACSFDRFLRVFCGFFGNAFFDRLRRGFHQIFGFFQT